MAKSRSRSTLLPAAILLLSACNPAATTPIPIDTELLAPTETSIETGKDASMDGAIDACSLVTQAKAESLLEKSTGPGVPEITPPFFSCSYETSDFDIVRVVVVVYEDASQAMAAYEMAIEINGYAELSDLEVRAYNAQPISM